MAGDGGGLDATSGDAPGNDATSLHQSPKRVLWDTRAVVSGTTITFGKPVQVHDLDTLDTWVDAALQAVAGSQGGSYCDPDGTGVTITDDGVVHVATAWVSVPGCCACDSNFTQSNAPDQGTAWNADAGFLLVLLPHRRRPRAQHSVRYATWNGTVWGAWDGRVVSVPVTRAGGRSSEHSHRAQLARAKRRVDGRRAQAEAHADLLDGELEELLPLDRG